MTDYIVKVIGHIARHAKTPELPDRIELDVIFRTEDLTGLKNGVNEQLINIIKNHGMIVPVDPERVPSGKFEPDSHMYVPLSSIAYVTTKTTKCVQPIPGEDFISI